MSEKINPKPIDKETRDTKRGTTGWGPISAVLVTIGVFFGSQILATAILGVYGLLRGYDAEQLVDQITASTTLQFVFIVMNGVITLALLNWFFRRRNIKLSQIGLGRWPRPGDILPAIVAFGLYFLAMGVVLVIVSVVAPGVNLSQEQQIGFDGVSGLLPLVLVFISLVITPSIVEEVMVRGFLYSGLKNKSSKWKAAIIASLLFAVAHLQVGSGQPLLWVAAIDTFVLSIFLIGLREHTKSLWSGMFVHFMKNSVAFISLFILTIG